MRAHLHTIAISSCRWFSMHVCGTWSLFAMLSSKWMLVHFEPYRALEILLLFCQYDEFDVRHTSVFRAFTLCELFCDYLNKTANIDRHSCGLRNIIIFRPVHLLLVNCMCVSSGTGGVPADISAQGGLISVRFSAWSTCQKFLKQSCEYCYLANS